MWRDVVLGLKQRFPVAVPYMLVAPLMIFVGNIWTLRSLVLSMPSDQNQARRGLFSYDFSFSWKETGTKEIRLSKLMQISLKIILSRYMNTLLFLRQFNNNFYGSRNSRKNKQWGKWVCRGAAGGVWKQVLMYSIHYCRYIHAAILELGSWHWEKRNSYLCKTLFLVQCPGLISPSLLSNQGSSSLINWILLKAKKTAPSLVITSIASPKFLTDWIAKKSMPTWRCMCNICIYIAMWCSLFMCHRGPRNRILLGQTFLPLANLWSRVAWEVTSGLNNVRKACTIFYYFLCMFFFCRPQFI